MRMPFCICAGVVAAFLVPGIKARGAGLDALWRSQAVEERIERGIRENRMGDAVLRFSDSGGRPVSNVTVRVAQTRHEFMFGANIFMLGGFPTPEENRRFEKAFASLFTGATLPFYWSDLEPEDGKPRFSKDSAPIYRRPPPDLAVEFCRGAGLAMKGHPLVWHQWYPKWRPDDPAEVMRRIERRIAEIAARYGDVIARWEVVNEPMERNQHADAWCNLPEDYVFRSLSAAGKAFPASCRLMLNEATTYSWLEFREEESPYYRLIREMIDRGARVDEIGMQLHIFSEQAWQMALAGERFAPSDLFKVLDRYGDFGRPIHITEITIPSLPHTAEGERDQALVARNFYRLWFSHPKVEAISWWNLVDGTAAKGEDKWNAGLLRRDFSVKPAFEALDQLINHEWKTAFETNSGRACEVRFRGFHGEYSVAAESGGTTVKKTFRLGRRGAAECRVAF